MAQKSAKAEKTKEIVFSKEQILSHVRPTPIKENKLTLEEKEKKKEPKKEKKEVKEEPDEESDDESGSEEEDKEEASEENE